MREFNYYFWYSEKQKNDIEDKKKWERLMVTKRGWFWTGSRWEEFTDVTKKGEKPNAYDDCSPVGYGSWQGPRGYFKIKREENED